jgi:RHS repeat-associated protein
VTTWLIDPNRDYAQTLEAYRGGQLATVWQFGDDLQAQANVVGGNVQERSLLMDGMGSVRQATNLTGSVTDSFEYDAFGEELSRTGVSDIDHRYRSEQIDANTGFYNLRARFMDPHLGLMIGQDSWRGIDADPISLNKFVYAGSNPVLYSDPTGHILTVLDVSFANIESAYVRERNAKNSYNAFDRIRETLCRACDNSVRVADQAHHAFPKFLGGPVIQNLIDLPEPIHSSLHRLLHIALIANGFPFSNKGAGAFDAVFKSDPTRRADAMKVLVNVSEFVDVACKGKLKQPVAPRVKGILDDLGIEH